MVDSINRIVVDCEFEGLTYLSLQVYIPAQKIVYFFYNKDYDFFVKEVSSEVTKVFKEFTVLYVSFDFCVDSDDLNCSVISVLELELKKVGRVFASVVFIEFYYSLKDIYCLFNKSLIASFFKNKRPQTLNNFIVQEGSFKGRFKVLLNGKNVTFKLKDLSGYERSGLSKLLNVCNIQNPVKSDFKDKSIMITHFKETPERFITYAIYDVITTGFVTPCLLEKVNNLYKSVYRFPEEFLLDCNTLPSTLGGIVANLIEKWIYFEMCSYEGVIDWKTFESFDKLDELLSIKKEFQKKTYSNKVKSWSVERKSLNSHSNNRGFQSRLVDAASVRAYAANFSDNTGCLNALVHGGRNINENESESIPSFSKLWVLDVDLKSCYGTSLMTYELPIGIPEVYGVVNEGVPITLKEFFKINNLDSENSLYQITISGQLSFFQNLLYSKDVDVKNLSKNLFSKKEGGIDFDRNDVTGSFKMMTYELLNAILTNDLMACLKNVCTTQELSEILNLKVVTASYYKKKNFIKDNKSFIKEVEKNPGSYHYDVPTRGNVDLRNRSWTNLRMERLIKPLIIARNDLKSKRFDALCEKDFEKVLFYDNSQEFFKKCINTIYGGFASIYFTIGNSVLANNVTARARLAGWYMGRSLLGTQLITDGTIYEPDRILKFKKNNVENARPLPGLETLSNINLLTKHRSVEITSLGGLKWSEILKGDQHYELQNSDRLVETHIEGFLKPYNLNLGFNLEHKMEHTSSMMVFVKKCHYALRPIKNLKVYEEGPLIQNKRDIIFKFRGLNERENPFYLKLVNHLLLGFDLNVTNEVDFDHEESKLSGIYEFLNSLKDKTLDKKELVYPCELIVKKRSFRYNFSEISVPDAAASKRLIKRSEDDWLKYKKMFELGHSFESIFNERTLDSQIFLNSEVKRIKKKCSKKPK